MLTRPAYRLIIVTCVIGLTACQPQEQATTDNEKSSQSTPIGSGQVEMIPQDLRAVKIGNITQKYPFTGSIQAEQNSLIISPITATAEAVTVKVGQTVQKGQVLLRLNNRDNLARLAQARANLMAAEAQLRQAQRIMLRKQRLLEQGFIAKVEYEQSQLDTQNQIENIAVQQANLDIASKALEDNQLISPISGTVSQRNVEVGQIVSAGQTVFEIVDPSTLEIRGQMPFDPEHAVQVGQTLQFSLSGGSSSYTATINRIVPVANPNNRQIEFFAKPNSTTPFSIGAFVQGQVMGQTSPSGQVLALDQIINPTGQAQVWVVRQNKLLRLPVQVIAIDQQQNLAVVSGLAAQDLVSSIRFNDQDQNKAVVISQP